MTARRSFEFRKSAQLVEATTIKARSLGQLLTGVTLADDLSIVFHLHRHFFVEPTVLSEYPNDFARWVGRTLGNGVMAERLANLNLFRTAGLPHVRREIAVMLAEYLAREGDAPLVDVSRQFIFCLPRLVIMPTRTVAATPWDLPAALQSVDIQSIGFHLFESAAGMSAGQNDFVRFFKAWGLDELASQLDALDPYLNCLEDNRSYLIELVTRLLPPPPDGAADA